MNAYFIKNILLRAGTEVELLKYITVIIKFIGHL